jgi:hypothetical protein
MFRQRIIYLRLLVVFFLELELLLELVELVPELDTKWPKALLTAFEIPSAALSRAWPATALPASTTLRFASRIAGESPALANHVRICSYRSRPALAPITYATPIPTMEVTFTMTPCVDPST